MNGQVIKLYKKLKCCKFKLQNFDDTNNTVHYSKLVKII